MKATRRAARTQRNRNPTRVSSMFSRAPGSTARTQACPRHDLLPRSAPRRAARVASALSLDAFLSRPHRDHHHHAPRHHRGHARLASQREGATKEPWQLPVDRAVHQGKASPQRARATGAARSSAKTQPSERRAAALLLLRPSAASLRHPPSQARPHAGGARQKASSGSPRGA
jgi:hypothetical protein